LEYYFWQLVFSLHQDETCDHKQKKSMKMLQHLAEQQIWLHLTFSKLTEKKNIYNDMGGVLLDAY
jgi:hypothetical protein